MEVIEKSFPGSQEVLFGARAVIYVNKIIRFNSTARFAYTDMWCKNNDNRSALDLQKAYCQKYIQSCK